MAAPTDHIGARIAYWRKRRGGMSQVVLAGLAGLSQSFISQVEAGRKGIERRATLVAIAAALQVSVADLVGEPGDSTDPVKATADAAIPAIRVAIVEIEEGVRRAPVRNVEQLSADIARLSELRTRAGYAEMATMLPGLLLDAAGHGGLWLARVGYEAGTTLKNLHHRDLALSAARVAVAASLDAEDPAWIGATRYFHTVTLPIESPALSFAVVERAISDMQSKAADPRARQMLGQLHLSAALTCAVSGREDEARAHLAAAAVEGDTLGDPSDGLGFNLLCFGPTNIGLWEMSVLSELGDPDAVVATARRLQPARLRIADRHYSYWLNLGRALAHSGRRDPEALAAFMHAERAAPLAFSLNPIAREAAVAMVFRARRRSVSGDLRVLARRLGVEAP